MTPRINVNLNDIPDFVSVDPGRHRAKLVECNEEESQAGHDMLVWNWIITEGDNEDRTIKSYSSLLEHALGNLKMHLQAFGYTGEVDVDTRKLHGKVAILVVTKRKVRSRETGEEIDLSSVSNVLPDTKVTKGSNRELGKKASVAVTSQEDDDIPF